jgi:formylglycine-generating enzyme required for sulfatase activity
LPFTSIRTETNGKLCYGLLNECLGYLGWWRFNELDAITVTDASTTKRTATVVNTPSWRAGAEWTGLATGFGAYATMPDDAALHTDSGTWEMAFKPLVTIDEGLSQSAPLLDKTAGFDDGYLLTISAWTGTPGKLKFILYDQESSSTIDLTSDASTWLKDTLYATGITFGDAGMQMVVNGQVQQDTDEHNGGISGSGVDLAIGGTFYGVVDSYRFMSRALSLDEMMQYPGLAWSPAEPEGPVTCSDTLCPELAGYEVACNSNGFCEYANEDNSGWRQWDVWVWLPPGTFTMGGLAGESGDLDEVPAHAVTFAKGYFVAKYEIAVAAYEACVADNNSCGVAAAADWDGGGWGTNKSLKGQPSHPQNGLSYAQAEAFCQWIAEDGRLPTEAEWEYAARGPLARPYPWGLTPTPTCDEELVVYSPTGNIGDYGCTNGGTQPIDYATLGASWCGALQMAGNVWEWVADWHHATYADAPADGSAWVEPVGTIRVRRGGSFAEDATKMRVSNREAAPPDNRAANVGGRCVRPAQ